ncbi:exosortase-dependent surface protein XDP1 [Massilia sp. CMS3.1]|uniref:exosortase-dependent surface protein XDP1 n=1 Tax=Massilia sp. CMS3.1 TaxID=3373083 RepID=UPI003EE4EE21
MTLNHFSSLAFTFAIVAAHGVAQAGAITFNESTCLSGSASATAFSCTTKVAGVNHTASASAWSAPTTGNFAGASMVYYPYAGIGVVAKGESTSGSQHATDNNGGTDAFLLNFGSSNFALNQISIGWRDGDADVSILRYTGKQAPSLGNSTVANLDSAAGWEWVGDYSSLQTNSTLNFNNNGNVKTAAWWLVSAYNSAYSTVPVSGTFGDSNDYFKLNGFGGNLVAVTPPPSDVPEPGTFALFGIALLGFAAARRKFQAK